MSITFANSISYEAQFVSKPSEPIPAGEQSGRVLFAYAKYSFSGAVVPADLVIKMLKLPIGAKIVDIKVKSSDFGSTGKCSLGYLNAGATDAGAELITEIDCTPSTGAAYSQTLLAAAMLSDLSAEQILALKVTEQSSATSGSIEIAVEYVVV